MEASERIVAAIHHVCQTQVRPVIVAIDGGSGAGKTTLAAAVRSLTDATIIHLDDFYTVLVQEHQWQGRSIAQRLHEVFDWERVCREALIPLRAGRPARWFAFDFGSGITSGGTYALRSEATEVAPARIFLLEGTYSASPPLADLIDLSVLVQVSPAERSRRTRLRDEATFSDRWHAIWDDVETYYFSRVRPLESFDLVVTNEFTNPDVIPSA